MISLINPAHKKFQFDLRQASKKASKKFLYVPGRQYLYSIRGGFRGEISAFG